LIERVEPVVVNRFTASSRSPADFAVPATSGQMHVIEAIDGQLITQRQIVEPKVIDGHVVSDTSRDILKLAVVNRYEDAPPAVAFIKNFGLRRGALASSVAHDSHNVIAVGVDDEDLCAAINLVIQARGGLSVVDGLSVTDGLSETEISTQEFLPLPIAGLMSTDTCQAVGEAYGRLDTLVKQLGSPLRAPFMTLSFMALLVIPDVKLSDRGLFDGQRFEFLPLFL
jgi:adenine deaminase